MAPTYCYECPNGHDYEEVLPVKDYRKQTSCPKCSGNGEKVIKFRQTETTFTEKLFPFYDKSVNRVFHSSTERKEWLDRKGYVHNGKDSMNRKQERTIYGWRLGSFDPKQMRHSRKD